MLPPQYEPRRDAARARADADHQPAAGAMSCPSRSSTSSARPPASRPARSSCCTAAAPTSTTCARARRARPRAPARRPHARARRCPAAGGGRWWYQVPRVGFPDPATFHATYARLHRVPRRLARRARDPVGAHDPRRLLDGLRHVVRDRPRPGPPLPRRHPRDERLHPDGRGLGARRSTTARGLPVFITHGARDPVISVEFARDARARLEAAGARRRLPRARRRAPHRSAHRAGDAGVDPTRASRASLSSVAAWTTNPTASRTSQGAPQRQPEVVGGAAAARRRRARRRCGWTSSSRRPARTQVARAHEAPAHARPTTSSRAARATRRTARSSGSCFGTTPPATWSLDAAQRVRDRDDRLRPRARRRRSTAGASARPRTRRPASRRACSASSCAGAQAEPDRRATLAGRPDSTPASDRCEQRDAPSQRRAAAAIDDGPGLQAADAPQRPQRRRSQLEDKTPAGSRRHVEHAARITNGGRGPGPRAACERDPQQVAVRRLRARRRSEVDAAQRVDAQAPRQRSCIRTTCV